MLLGLVRLNHFLFQLVKLLKIRVNIVLFRRALWIGRSLARIDFFAWVLIWCKLREIWFRDFYYITALIIRLHFFLLWTPLLFILFCFQALFFRKLMELIRLCILNKVSFFIILIIRDHPRFDYPFASPFNEFAFLWIQVVIFRFNKNTIY